MSEVYYYRGYSYEKLGQNSKALSDFDKAIQLDTGNTLAIERKNNLE